MIKKFIILILSVLFLFSCAAQGTAYGGPEDREGPIIKSIIPKNGSTQIIEDQQIVIEFDELLDPTAFPSAIQIIPEVAFNVKVKRRSIHISPKTNWSKNSPFEILISRRVRDYQGNGIDQDIQLIYSRGAEFPIGEISGRLLNVHEKDHFEIGLFHWPLLDSSIAVKITESNSEGKFSFKHIESGEYTLFAYLGKLRDPIEDIHQSNYGMMSIDFIIIDGDQTVADIDIYVDRPLIRNQITEVEIINERFCHIILSDDSVIDFDIDNYKNPGDSIWVLLSDNNRIEAYELDPYVFILPIKLDTISPKVSSLEWNNGSLELYFTEPIITDSIIHIETSIDSIIIPISYQSINSSCIQLKDVDSLWSTISVLSMSVVDLFGNTMIDSINSVKIPHQIVPQLISGGNLSGRIENFHLLVKVEATHLETSIKTIVESNEKLFEFEDLSAGHYTFKAFQIKNEHNPDIYFSGTWEPYSPAARMSHYPDTIEVRPRWDVEGIVIPF